MSDTDLTVGNPGKEIAVPKVSVPSRPSERDPGTNISPADYFKSKELQHGGDDEDLDLTPSRTKADVDITEPKAKEKSSELQALNFWNRNIRNVFNSQSEKVKKAWMESFAIIEKGFAKRAADLEDRLSPSEDIIDIIEVLTPIMPELEKLKLSPAEYIERRIKEDREIGKDPYLYVAKLCILNNLGLKELQGTLDYARQSLEREREEGGELSNIKKELKALKSVVGQIEAPHDPDSDVAKAEEISENIKNFYNQRDKKGNELYPDAVKYIPAIFAFIEQGYSLDEAYKEAVLGGMISDDDDTPPEIDYDVEGVAVGSDLKNPMQKYSKAYEQKMLQRELDKILSRKR
jgi:hypothetical protein